MMKAHLFPTWVKTLLLLVFAVGSFGFANAQACSQPSNLNSNVVAGNIVSVSWAEIPGALTYTVQYRIGTSGLWTGGGTVTTPNQVIANLQPETVYQWRVRANCSSFSSVATFTSGGGVGGNTACSQPSNQVADVTTPTSVDLSWAGVEGALYYTVQYRLTGALGWRNAGSVTGLALTVNGLELNSEYQWRVKASCSVYSSVATFNTAALGGNATCSQPSNLDVLELTTSSATLSWSEIIEATDYTVEYRVGLLGDFISAGTVAGTSLTLNGLLPGTEYSWRVKASCSDFASQAVFTTTTTTTGGGGGTGGGGATICSSPSNTNVVAAFPTSANIAWEAQGGALDYTVQFRRKNTFTYTTLGTFTVATATLTGLTPGVEYEWRVKANCSPYGSDVSFTTPFTAFRARVAEPTAVAIFPNPVSASEFFIRSEADGARLSITNLAGQVLETRVLNIGQQTVNVAKLGNGLYFARLQYNDGSIQTAKFTIAR